MAKVTGPLFSVAAKGTIGKTITFMKRGPTAFVRVVVKPIQRWSENYTFQTYIQGGCSSAVGRIRRGGYFYNEILKDGVSSSKFQGQIISKLKAGFFVSDADFHSYYDDLFDIEYHWSFDQKAEARGFRKFYYPRWTKNYHFSSGFQLYILALLAVRIHQTRSSIFNNWPATQDVSTWGVSEISAFANWVRVV